MAFQVQAGDTLNFFDLRATNIYATLYNSWLFAKGIISLEGDPKLLFSFERAAVTTPHFVNI